MKKRIGRKATDTFLATELFFREIAGINKTTFYLPE